jgi:hypothetical protein
MANRPTQSGHGPDSTVTVTGSTGNLTSLARDPGATSVTAAQSHSGVSAAHARLEPQSLLVHATSATARSGSVTDSDLDHFPHSTENETSVRLSTLRHTLGPGGRGTISDTGQSRRRNLSHWPTGGQPRRCNLSHWSTSAVTVAQSQPVTGQSRWCNLIQAG